MTDRDRLIAALTACLVQHTLRRLTEEKMPAIHPTMRPDPQAVSLSHGTLIYASA
jgi:hypothetical protein